MAKIWGLFILLGLSMGAFAAPVADPLAHIAALKAQSHVLARQALEDILRELARHPSPENDRLVTELLEQNPDLVAEIADAIEPAAGPSPAPEFGSGEATAFDIPLENPNQISANQP
jgi:hypothetical protein